MQNVFAALLRRDSVFSFLIIMGIILFSGAAFALGESLEGLQLVNGYTKISTHSEATTYVAYSAESGTGDGFGTITFSPSGYLFSATNCSSSTANGHYITYDSSCTQIDSSPYNENTGMVCSAPREVEELMIHSGNINRTIYFDYNPPNCSLPLASYHEVNSYETSYTFVLEEDADTLEIRGDFYMFPGTDTQMEPNWDVLFMNGVLPSSITPCSFCLPWWRAQLVWTVPISGSAGDTVTLSPSTANQQAYGTLKHVRAFHSVCVDKDGDGHKMKSAECPLGDDCNDNDPTVYQGCVCNDWDTQSCYTGPAGTLGIGVCASGTQVCAQNTWGSCEGSVLPSPEVCDGLDNDCNGVADDIPAQTCYTGPSGTQGLGLCQGGTQACTGGQWSACIGEILPVKEVCDNDLDDDCNGLTDEGCTSKDEVCTKSSVNMATGNLSHSQSLYKTRKAILPFDLNLTYNSSDGDGPLGRGWTHSYNISIKPSSNGGYVYGQADGTKTGLTLNGTQFTPLSSEYPALTVNAGGTYMLQQKDGTVYGFNQNGKITSIRDKYSNAIIFIYNANNLTGISDSQGRVMSFTYNADNRIETITDPNNNIHTFTYGYSFLIDLTTYTSDSLPLTWTYNYDDDGGNGGMQRKTNPMNQTITYVYQNNRLAYVIDNEYKIQTLTFDPASTTSTIAKGEDSRWIYRYEPAKGKLVSKTDPEGYVTTYAYDANMETVTDAKGNITENIYDSRKNLLSTTKKSASDPVGRTTRYTYNADNEILTITDPEDHTTTYTYETVDGEKLVRIENPSHKKSETRYYADGRIKYSKNAKNQTTSFTYAFDQNTKTTTETSTDFLGVSTSRVYDLSGNMIESRDAFDTVTKYEYNSLNQLKTVKDYLGRVVTSYEYWPDSNVKAATDANGNPTYYEYNYDGKITKTVDALGNTTTYTYGSGTGCPSCSGGGDNLVSVTDANNKTTTYEYYKNGLRKSQADPLNHVTKYEHDPSGFMTSLTDPAQAVTAFNKIDLVIAKTDPLGRVTTYEYDKAGRLKTRTDRKGNVIRYTYAPDNMLEVISYPDNSTVTFTNDELGRTTRMTDSLGITTYVYDDPNRTVTVTDPHGFVVVYRNDGAGRLKELTYPGNKKVIYGYDKLNRMETVKLDWLNQTTTYQYDAAGRMRSLTNFNGTVTTYGYDNAGRLTSLENKKSDSSIISSYNFPVLDGVGNRKQIVVNEPLAPILNPEDTGYTYNTKKNRLEKAGTENFVHDNEGQLSNINADAYTFDYEHRLATISGQQFTISYFYDGKGDRLSAVRNGVAASDIYDMNGNVLAEADGSKNITRLYIQGAGLLAMVAPNDQVYSYHFNAIGSTVAMTDQNQNVVNKYAYDSFGAVLNQDETVPQPFKYVGRYGVMIEPNGFYYMRARYYDTKVGRFISEDPIGFGGGTVNLYEYAENNPGNRVDPSGLMLIDPSGFYDDSAHPDNDKSKEMQCKGPDDCFKGFVNCMADGLLAPGWSTWVNGTADAGSFFATAMAWAHAAAQGLTYPLRSSIVRSLLEKAVKLSPGVSLAVVDIYVGICLKEELDCLDKYW